MRNAQEGCAFQVPSMYFRNWAYDASLECETSRYKCSKNCVFMQFPWFGKALEFLLEKVVIV